MLKARLGAVAIAISLAIPVFAQTQQPDPAQDPLSKPISLAMKATTVEKIVDAVAKKLDVKLEVTPQITNEIIIVAVDNVTGKQLLDKIAATAVGVWIQDGDTLRLQRNFSQVQREDREALQAAAAKIKKEIKDLYDQVNGKAKKEDQNASISFGGMFGGDGSDTKVISSLLMGVDPNLIAGLRNGERLVFASPNTRMQRPLTGNVANLVAQWIADHNKTAKEHEANKANGENDMNVEGVDMKELEEFLKMFGISEPKTIDERPAKVIMVLSSGMPGMGGMGAMMPFGGDSVSVELKLYNSKGQVILRGSHQLGLNMEAMQEIAEMAKPQDEKPKPKEDDTKIEYSKPTTALMTMFGGMMTGQMPQLDKELEAVLLRPDENDPLSFAPSEALLSVAKAKKLNIVASLPDDSMSFMGLMMGRSGPTTVNAYLQALKADKSLWVTSEGTWLTVTPKNPTAARASRTNRQALAKLLGVIQAKGVATLDDLAAYAQVAEAPGTTPAAQTYLMLFAPGAIQQGFTGMTDWDALRFYGTLNVSQKKTLADGGQLPYSNLAPNQRDLIAKMAFGTASKLEIGSEPKPKGPGGFLALMTAFMPGQDKDYRQEPTEIMPNGLPAAGYITGDITKQFIGNVVGEGMGMFSRTAIGTDELAMLEWMRTDPTLSQATAMVPQIQQVRPGERTHYAFSFFVAQDVLFHRTLNDDQIDKDAKPIALANLPQNVQDEIKKKVEEFKKNPIPFMGGAGVKPPQPSPN